MREGEAEGGREGGEGAQGNRGRGGGGEGGDTVRGRRVIVSSPPSLGAHRIREKGRRRIVSVSPSLGEMCVCVWGGGGGKRKECPSYLHTYVQLLQKHCKRVCITESQVSSPPPQTHWITSVVCSLMLSSRAASRLTIACARTSPSSPIPCPRQTSLSLSPSPLTGLSAWLPGNQMWLLWSSHVSSVLHLLYVSLNRAPSLSGSTYCPLTNTVPYLEHIMHHGGIGSCEKFGGADANCAPTVEPHLLLHSLTRLSNAFF